MFGKLLVFTAVVALLLVTVITPTTAMLPKGGDAILTQAMAGSTPDGSLLVFPLGRFQPNGDCESGGNGSCPNPG